MCAGVCVTLPFTVLIRLMLLPLQFSFRNQNYYICMRLLNTILIHMSHKILQIAACVSLLTSLIVRIYSCFARSLPRKLLLLSLLKCFQSQPQRACLNLIYLNLFTSLLVLHHFNVTAVFFSCVFHIFNISSNCKQHIF